MIGTRGPYLSTAIKVSCYSIMFRVIMLLSDFSVAWWRKNRSLLCLSVIQSEEEDQMKIQNKDIFLYRNILRWIIETSCTEDYFPP